MSCPYGSFANLCGQCKNICHEKTIDSCVNDLRGRDFREQRAWPAASGLQHPATAFGCSTNSGGQSSATACCERSTNLCARGTGEAVYYGQFPINIDHAQKT